MQQELDSIDQVKKAFTEWRSLRPKRCPIPDYLWDMVKPLLDEYPRSMISRVLGISSSKIKSRFIDNKVTFVEAVPNNVKSPPTDLQSAINQEQSCDIELKRPCGSILKIYSLPLTMVATLMPSFVSQ